MSHEVDLAWAAGLFEGEGWITVGRISGKPKRQLGLITTDLDVLRRFHAIVQAGAIGERQLREAWHKPAWVWQTGKMRDVERILIAFLPWLGERRATKARECLTSCAASRIALIDNLHDNGVRTTRELEAKRRVDDPGLRS